MTDERIGDALIRTLLALPPGAGVVFRHYGLPRAARYRLFLRVRRLACARGLRMSAAGGLPGAGRHNGHGALTHAAHDRREAVAAIRKGAAWLFVSPVFATRSHAGAAPLGVRRATAIASAAARNVTGGNVTGGKAAGTNPSRVAVALGGMTATRWLRIRHHGFAGWAAIDALVVAAPR